MARVLTSIRGGLKLMDKYTYMCNVDYCYKFPRYWKCSSTVCKTRAKASNVEIDLLTAKFSTAKFFYGRIPSRQTFLSAKYPYNVIFSNEIFKGKVPTAKFPVMR